MTNVYLLLLLSLQVWRALRLDDVTSSPFPLILPPPPYVSALNRLTVPVAQQPFVALGKDWSCFGRPDLPQVCRSRESKYWCRGPQSDDCTATKPVVIWKPRDARNPWWKWPTSFHSGPAMPCRGSLALFCRCQGCFFHRDEQTHVSHAKHRILMARILVHDNMKIQERRVPSAFHEMSTIFHPHLMAPSAAYAPAKSICASWPWI
jgi:hypothetical protein